MSVESNRRLSYAGEPTADFIGYIEPSCRPHGEAFVSGSGFAVRAVDPITALKTVDGRLAVVDLAFPKAITGGVTGWQWVRNLACGYRMVIAMTRPRSVCPPDLAGRTIRAWLDPDSGSFRYRLARRAKAPAPNSPKPIRLPHGAGTHPGAAAPIRRVA